MSKPMVFLDMDGVIVDFVGGICEAHDRPNPYEEESSFGEWDIAKLFKMESNEFWAPSNKEEFWENLEWTSDGKQILQLVEKIAGPENVYLLTSPSLAPESLSGKMKWVQREMIAYERRTILCPCKAVIAGCRKILIDDSYDNCKEWSVMGGWGIMIARPWNRCHSDSSSTLEGLQEHLEKVILNLGKMKRRSKK